MKAWDLPENFKDACLADIVSTDDDKQIANIRDRDIFKTFVVLNFEFSEQHFDLLKTVAITSLLQNIKLINRCPRAGGPASG